MSTRELQLQGDVRQAIENYMGDMVSGPWDAVVEILQRVICESGISIDEAARLNLAFAQLAEPGRDQCPACHGVIRADGMRW